MFMASPENASYGYEDMSIIALPEINKSFAKTLGTQFSFDSEAIFPKETVVCITAIQCFARLLFVHLNSQFNIGQREKEKIAFSSFLHVFDLFTALFLEMNY